MIDLFTDFTSTQKRKRKRSYDFFEAISEFDSGVKKEAKILSDLYYKEGMTFGRDALYHHLKTLYPKEEDRPSRRTVMKWLQPEKEVRL